MATILWAVVLSVVSSLVLGLGSPEPASAATGTITDISVTASTAKTSTAATYAYSFVTQTTATLTKIVATLPSGTTGTPTLSSVSGLGAGTFTSTTSGTRTATYAVRTAVSVPSGTVITFAIGGVTNPTSATTTTTASTKIDTYSGTSTLVDEGTTSLWISGTTLSPTMSAGSAVPGTANVSYTFGFTTGSTGTKTITLTLPPGMSGTPTVGTATSGGTAFTHTLSVSLPTLTVGVSGTALTSNKVVSLVITGLTNTSTAGSYASAVTTYNSSGAILNAGTTAALVLKGTLATPTWSASSATVSGTGATYTYDFTTYSAATIDTVTMTLPASTPTPGTMATVTHTGLGSGTFTYSATTSPTLTYTLDTPVVVPAGTAVELAVSGMKNTTVAGTYASTITTLSGISTTTTGTTTDDTGVTPSVVFAKALTAASWSASSQTTGQASTYTFNITPATTGATKVTMTLPPNTTGSGITVKNTSGATIGTAPAPTTSAGVTTLTVTPNQALTTAAATLVIGGLTNIATPGSFTSTITTYTSSGALADSGVTGPLVLTGALTSPSWTATSAAVNDTGVSYTYAFTTATAASLTKVTLSLGTAPANLSLTSVSGLGGGSVGYAGNTLTYTVDPANVANVPANRTVTLVVGGMTNPSSPGSPTATITTYAGATAEDTAVTPALDFTTALTQVSWQASPATPNTASTYTFQFTANSASSLTKVSFTLPANTGTSGTLTTSSASVLPTNGTYNLTGSTLTYAFGSTPVPVGVGTVMKLVVSGLKNTTTGGVYTSTISTYSGTNGTTAQDKGTTNAVPIATTPTAGGLTNTSWTTTSTLVGDTGVSYTFGFTTHTAAGLNWLSVQLPAGTSGTPTVTSFFGEPYNGSQPSGVASASLSGSTLVVTFNAGNNWMANGPYFLTVGGLTNTSTPGSYTADVATYAGGTGEDEGTAGTVTFGSASNAPTGVTWAASNTTTSGSSAYTYTFRMPADATMSKVVMTVPGGTTGTPVVGTVSPAAVAAGGSATLSTAASTLTYTFTPTLVSAGQVVSITINGLTNPPTQQSTVAEVAAYQDTTLLGAGISNMVAFTPATLTPLTWSASNTATSATDSTYTFSFTTTNAGQTDTMTFTVPPGTTGQPTVSSVSGYYGSTSLGITNPHVSLSGTTLTVTVTSFYMHSDNGGSVVTVVIGGLTNTSLTGDFQSEMATYDRTRAGSGLQLSGTAHSATFSSVQLTAVSWASSNLIVSQPGVTYTYGFGVTSAATVDKVTMTLPLGTGTTGVGVGTVTPLSIAGGQVSVSGTVVTYTFPSTYTINPSTTISIGITGITNTGTAAAYTTQITALSGSSGIASAVSPIVTFAAGALTNASFIPSATAVGASATYTWGFTLPTTGLNLSSVSFTVPSGTTGVPHLDTANVAIHDQNGSVTLPSPTISRSDTTITLSFSSSGASMFFQGSTSFTLPVTGLTNTSSPVSFGSTITVYNGNTPQDSATTATVSFSAVTVGTPVWNTTSSATGTTAAYTYSFTPSVNATVASMTFSLPQGTGPGTGTLGAVSPSQIAGGTLSRSGDTLTYTFPAAQLTGGANVSIQVTGLTNTVSADTYTTAITLFDADQVVIASGTSTSVTFLSPGNTMTQVTWTPTPAMTGVSQVVYEWKFTTASQQSGLTSVTMTVPQGTGGTPQFQSLTSPGATLSNPSVNLNGTVMTLSFTSAYVPSGTVITLDVSGMTNTTVPGSFSSSVTTTNNSTPKDSGVSAAVPLTAPPSTTMTWTPSRAVAKAPNVSYAYGFTTVSAPTLTSIVLTVPPGTTPQGSAPTLSTLSPMGLTGAAVALNQSANTLTVTFPSYSLPNNTAVSIVVGGLHNSGFVGPFVATAALKNSTGTVGTATAAPVTIQAQKTNLTTSCVAGTGCSLASGGGTAITLIAIPGAPSPVVGGVQLSVQSNASFGYVLSAISSDLMRVGGTETLPLAPGTSALVPNELGVTAAITAASGSGAQLCSSYSTSGVVAGYATGSSAPIWYAPSSTGTGSDTVTLSNLVRVSPTQPAGVYTGTINFSLTPNYTSVGEC